MKILMVRAGARLGNVCGDAIVVLDQAEHQRRRQAGLGAIAQLWLLDTLSQLPAGTPVPLEWLHERDQRRVAGLPAAAVERTAGGVIRHLRPAVEVIGAQVSSGNWASRIRRAATLARFVPTSIVVKKRPSPERLSEADFHGVGVIEGEPGLNAAQAGHTLLAPVVPVPCYQAVQWLFNEDAYATWLIKSSEADTTEERRAMTSDSKRIDAGRKEREETLDRTYDRWHDADLLDSVHAGDPEVTAGARATYDAAVQALQNYDTGHSHELLSTEDHTAQGQTVDAAHLTTSSDATEAGTYIATARGRDNAASVAEDADEL